MVRKTIPSSVVSQDKSAKVRRLLDASATRRKYFLVGSVAAFFAARPAALEGPARTSWCGRSRLRRSPLPQHGRLPIQQLPNCIRKLFAGHNISISSAHAGPGRCLPLLLALAIAGCNTQNLRDSGSADIRTHADTVYQNGDWQSAEQDYLYLTRQADTGARDWYRLGNIYAHMNRSDDAVAAYREALKYDQGNSDVWNNLGLVQLRQATQTFINMVNHTDANDPLNLRARYAVTAITELLETRFNTSDAE